MKHSILTLSLGLALLGATAPQSTHAQVASIDKDAFGEGTRFTPLTLDDKVKLLAFVRESKATLRRALEDGQKLTFEDARAVYYEAIYNTVHRSFEKALANELLMRMVLNQALKSTYGLRPIPGVTNGFPGALYGTLNRDVITLILKESIEMAIQAAIDDEVVLDSNGVQLTDGASIPVANQRLRSAKLWLTTIPSPYFQRRFLFDALEDWHGMVKRVDEPRRAMYADEILQIEEALATGLMPSLSTLKRYFNHINKIIGPIDGAAQ